MSRRTSEPGLFVARSVAGTVVACSYSTYGALPRSATSSGSASTMLTSVVSSLSLVRSPAFRPRASRSSTVGGLDMPAERIETDALSELSQLSQA